MLNIISILLPEELAMKVSRALRHAPRHHKQAAPGHGLYARAALLRPLSTGIAACNTGTRDLRLIAQVVHHVRVVALDRRRHRGVGIYVCVGVRTVVPGWGVGGLPPPHAQVVVRGQHVERGQGAVFGELRRDAAVAV